jgi:hypothetical protein
MPALGVAVAVPGDWTERMAIVKGTRGIAFSNEQHRSDSAEKLLVIVDGSSLREAVLEVVTNMRHPPAGTDPIALAEGVVLSGRPAIRYTFDEGDQYVQQWWIARPGRSGTFFMEFRSSTATEHEATLLADRILRTFVVK